MKHSSRREFIEMAGTLALFSLVMTGCKTMETLEQNVGSIMGSMGKSQDTEKTSLLFSSAKAIGKSFEDFTPEHEYYIGRTVGAQLLEKYPPFKNNKANDYTNVLGQTLAKASDMPETFGGYHFLVQNSDEINAFAAPGGLIFITKGMIRCCDTEDALAAVLAHEIGHIQSRHGIQSIKKSRLTETFTALGMEGVKQYSGGNLGALVDVFEKSISDITKTLVTNGYSRSYEKQADMAAVTILKRVGYDPASLVTMLQKMDEQLVPGRKDFSQTHPKPGERINAIQKECGSRPEKNQSKARLTRFKSILGSV